MSRERDEVELEIATAGDAAGGRVARAADADSLAVSAERRRRAGDAEGALALAREALDADPACTAARATAALALLDLGRDAELRRELEALVAAPLAPAADSLDVLDEGEIEQAFADAAPEQGAMQDANEIAFDAMRAAALDGPELVDPTAAGSPFATRTMAALLEQQGDRESAAEIRARLARRPFPSDDEPAPRAGRRREDAIRTLERWLEQLRRGDA
jgi:hypothetical protein